MVIRRVSFEGSSQGHLIGAPLVKSGKIFEPNVIFSLIQKCAEKFNKMVEKFHHYVKRHPERVQYLTDSDYFGTIEKL